jgi:hypothetical protein
MRASEPGVTWYVGAHQTGAALADAVDAFNRVFGYGLTLPALPEDIDAAAELAALRGRQDVADDLRLALKQTLQSDE